MDVFSCNLKVYVVILFFNTASDWCRMCVLRKCCHKYISLLFVTGFQKCFCLLLFFFKKLWEDISPFVGPFISLFWTSGDVSSEFYLCLAEAYVLHVPWDSPLVQHQLTSWWPAWQPSCFLPRTCEQALVGLKTGTYFAATHSVRPGRCSTDRTMPAWDLNFGFCRKDNKKSDRCQIHEKVGLTNFIFLDVDFLDPLWKIDLKV